jgi:CDP-diacylglycerol--glycerol-3-phosphate 3-phosphatidyltransferase/cardiolipin synthase
VHDGTKLRNVPYIIATLRIVLSPLFFYTCIQNLSIITIGLFITIALTDILDGHIAKILEVTSKSFLESYIDAIADFVFVLTSFFVFAIKGIYPFWLPIIPIVMFLFFAITSNSNRPIYDPIGKYYGSFLFAAIGFTLFFPIVIIYNSIFFCILVYTAVLIVYRSSFLLKIRKEMVNTEEENDFL